MVPGSTMPATIRLDPCGYEAVLPRLAYRPDIMSQPPGHIPVESTCPLNLISTVNIIVLGTGQLPTKTSLFLSFFLLILGLFLTRNLYVNDLETPN